MEVNAKKRTGGLNSKRCACIFPFLLMLFVHPIQFGSWWTIQASGRDTNLRGVSVKRAGGNAKKERFVIWASGSNGVILRSSDEGKTWQQFSVAGGGELDFRDIEAFDSDLAYAMSSGEGDKSRIYKTADGGKTWNLQYSDKRAGFFLDSLACDSKTHCVALSDPVDGKFVVLSTDDGEHWKELSRDKMPAALPQEGAFAASGTAITLCARGIYFATGGPKARVFFSSDRGQSWSATETLIASGNSSSGIFSIACGDSSNLVAVGGDYQAPDNASKTAIYSADAGKSWHLAESQPGGYRSAVAWLARGEFAAVGTNGTDVSQDNGIHWEHTDKINLNAAAFDGSAGWAVGPKGAIARFRSNFFHEIKTAAPSEKKCRRKGIEISRVESVGGGCFLRAEAGVRADQKLVEFILR